MMQDYLERRARLLLIWAERSSVALLEPPHPRRMSAVVPALVASRLCCAAEMLALVSCSRDSCRSLGRLTVLAPVFRLLLHGFEQIRTLTDVAMDSLGHLDEVEKSARSRLSSITKADLLALKAQAQAATGVVCRAAPAGPSADLVRGVLELASMLLQPNEKAHDDFAMQRLIRDGVMEKVEAFQIEKLHPVQRQRFQKSAALRAEILSAAVSDASAVGALAEWLQALQTSLEGNQRICSVYAAREAVLMHIVPLAKWACRPHLRPNSLGRVSPPPPEQLPAEWCSRRAGAASRPPLSAASAVQDNPASQIQRPKYHARVRRPQWQGISVPRCVTQQTPLEKVAGQGKPRSLSAPQAVELWLQQHGSSICSNTSSPELRNSTSPETLPAGPGAAAVLALAKARNKGSSGTGPMSTCSTASTEDDGGSDRGPTRRSSLTSAAECGSLTEVAAAAAARVTATLSPPPPPQPPLIDDIGEAAQASVAGVNGFLDEADSSMLLELSDDDADQSPSIWQGGGAMSTSWAFGSQRQ